MAVAVTPDGQRALSASDDRSLRLWDLEDGAELAAFHADAAIQCRAVSQDKKRIVAEGTGLRNDQGAGSCGEQGRLGAACLRLSGGVEDGMGPSSGCNQNGFLRRQLPGGARASRAQGTTKSASFGFIASVGGKADVPATWPGSPLSARRQSSTLSPVQMDSSPISR